MQIFVLYTEISIIIEIRFGVFWIVLRKIYRCSYGVRRWTGRKRKDGDHGSFPVKIGRVGMFRDPGSISHHDGSTLVRL